MPRKSESEKTAKAKEEYERFLEIARELGASEKDKDFDKAFKKVTKKHPS